MERKNAGDYPQELLDLFDRFVHGDIDRRAFRDRAKMFAIGVTATAMLESLRPNFAWAQQVGAQDPRTSTETVTVPSPQGNGNVKGHFARRGTRAAGSPGEARLGAHAGLVQPAPARLKPSAGPANDHRCCPGAG